MPNQAQNPHPHSVPPKRRPSDFLAVIGLLIVGIIILWGLIHVARLASPWFDSLFTAKPAPTQKTQTVTKPTAVAMPLPVLSQPETKPAKPVATPKKVSPADLSVHIVSISSDPYGNGVVEFDISNVGGSQTGVWYFEVSLPTDAGYTYFSPAQKSLAPGDHIANTLQFSQISQYGGIVSIQVDPANTVHESSEGNNYASQAIGMNNYQPQPYYTY